MGPGGAITARTGTDERLETHSRHPTIGHAYLLSNAVDKNELVSYEFYLGSERNNGAAAAGWEVFFDK
jgi:hypothetical protein